MKNISFILKDIFFLVLTRLFIDNLNKIICNNYKMNYINSFNMIKAPTFNFTV